MIQRVLLGGAAVVAIAVIALWLHSSHLESQGRAFRPSPAHPVTPAQVNRALSEFDRARKNNPDTRPEVEEATILIFLGRNAKAAAMLRQVVRKEPQNAQAWGFLSLATRTLDPQLSQAAAARVLKLAPPVGG